ncbi:hypothetical protein M752DRAFT_278500 [Aspergillus phoenicis ATCC 13157]|nr:hypothetical protein M752DRAFT_278500 [Aspergillus phoenicis ATCC 13157]
MPLSAISRTNCWQTSLSKDVQVTTRATHLRSATKKSNEERDQQGMLLVPWLDDDRPAYPHPTNQSANCTCCAAGCIPD